MGHVQDDGFAAGQLAERGEVADLAGRQFRGCAEVESLEGGLGLEAGAADPAPGICLSGREGTVEFGQVVAQRGGGRGAGDLPVGDVLAEGLVELLVLLLFLLCLLAAGVEQQRLEVSVQVLSGLGSEAGAPCPNPFCCG